MQQQMTQIGYVAVNAFVFFQRDANIEKEAKP